jgi:hypothetical protein
MDGVHLSLSDFSQCAYTRALFEAIRMKSQFILAALALCILTVSYLGYLLGSAFASSVCEHEWCRFYIPCLCTLFFAMAGGFLVACLVAPTHAPEICHACCSLTGDCVSDIACSLVIDHCVQ